MMNTKIPVFVLLGLISLGVISFLVGIPQSVYNFSSAAARGQINIKDIQLYGLIGFLLLSIIFAISSFTLSKKRNRNSFVWTILGVLFNVWAFLLLYLLPSRK